MRFQAKMDGREISGDVVNPGDADGRCWIVENGIGYSSFFRVVEAYNVGDALDRLTDSEDHGHVVRMEPDDDRYHDNDTPRAGNAGEPVDLDNIMIHSTDRVTDILYITDEGVMTTPAGYMNMFVWDHH